MTGLLKLNGMYLANTQHSNNWETDPTLTNDRKKAMTFCPVKILDLVDTYKEHWTEKKMTFEIEEV